MHPIATVGKAIRGTGAVALLLSAAAVRGDQPEPGPVAREAIAICQAADQAPASERAAVLAIGLARAEDAVQADPRDAAAHFAVFCNLGKGLMDRSGWGLLAVFGDLSRVRKEIDLALTLAPDYSGALAAKGAMLAELPRLLGGDPQEGARLLRRAVELDPDDAKMRLLLATVLQAVGQDAAAREHAAVALGILERTGPADELATARTFVASIQ
jgi:tetratricopeptide (TPR) repeat protein